MFKYLVACTLVFSGVAYANEPPIEFSEKIMASIKMQSFVAADTVEYIHLATQDLRKIVGDRYKYYIATIEDKDHQVDVHFHIPRKELVLGGGAVTISVDKSTKEISRGALAK